MVLAIAVNGRRRRNRLLPNNEPWWVKNSQEAALEDVLASVRHTNGSSSNGHSSSLDLGYIQLQIDALFAHNHAIRALNSNDAKMLSDHWKSVEDFYAAQINGDALELLENYVNRIFNNLKGSANMIASAFGYAGSAIAHGLNFAGKTAAETYSLVPRPLRPIAAYGLVGIGIACSGSAGAINPANTPTPTPNVRTATPQGHEQNLEGKVAEATPVPVPPNFLIQEDSFAYATGILNENGKAAPEISARFDNQGGSGNIDGKLYHLNDPNNPKGTLLAQSSLQLAANNSGKIDIKGFELSPGIDYNLRADYINQATGEIIQTFNFSKYVPRVAELQFNAVYDKAGKEVKLAFANASKDPRDKSAENVSIEFLYQGKSSGQLNRNGTSFAPNSSIEEVVPIKDIETAINRELGHGTHEITAQIKYHDGLQERSYTKTFVVDVPFPPPTATPQPTPAPQPTATPTHVPSANLIFAEIPESNNKITIGFDKIDANLETMLRSDLPYTFRLNIINNGNIKSERAVLEFYRDSIKPSNKLAFVRVPQIELGNSYKIASKFKINATGVHRIYAAIPLYNLTLETIVAVEAAPTKITVPHHSFGFNPYHKKYLDAGGIPIIGSDKVSDAAFYAARNVVDGMLSTRPDIRATLIEYNTRVAIIPETGFLTDIPEWSDLYKKFPDKDWKFYRGIGGGRDLPVPVTAEENLLCKANGKWYSYSTLVHEFAHTIMDIGLLSTDEGLAIIREVRKSYDDALKQGKYQNAYAGANDLEYWAETVGTWFDTNRIPIVPGVVFIDTREKLKSYDPQIASLIHRVFGDNKWTYRCPNNGQ